VIVLTLGDGYLEAAARLSGHSEPSQADYRALGAARTQETRDAAALLGVRELVLLGAPDDGLGALWAQPDVPLVSPATGAGPFSGRALLGSLRAAIEDGSPTLVVAPDPRDHHADHAAAGRFTLAAVADFRSAPTILTYLVHDTVWPPPLANGRDMPAPGAGYEDTRWVDFRLTSDELAVKRSALAAYRTQWPIMGGLLERFLRDNEVFATR
jgi:LmbE family N-acetylglucosaminyl deacetylase